MNYKVFPSLTGNVWKYVFHFDGAIAEAVLYKYPDFHTRTVLCISVQSGCPVGCLFCGTGNRFIRNLTHDEIVLEVNTVLNDELGKFGIRNINTECAKLQIMFMSMGEPFLNYQEVKLAIEELSDIYGNADLLISTVCPDNRVDLVDFIELSKQIPKIGLQFSIHASNDAARDNLIPLRKKLSLRQIRDYGVQWWHETGRKPYLNYCVDGPVNIYDYTELTNLFPVNVFCFTFSVICSADETMKDAGFRNHDIIQEWVKVFANQGYDVRMFDPAGQDDIGGGCGQLFYTQRFLKELGQK